AVGQAVDPLGRPDIAHHRSLQHHRSFSVLAGARSIGTPRALALSLASGVRTARGPRTSLAPALAAATTVRSVTAPLSIRCSAAAAPNAATPAAATPAAARPTAETPAAASAPPPTRCAGGPCAQPDPDPPANQVPAQLGVVGELEYPQRERVQVIVSADANRPRGVITALVMTGSVRGCRSTWRRTLRVAPCL